MHFYMTTNPVTVRPRFGGGEILFAGFISLVIVVLGILLLTILLPSEQSESSFTIKHDVTYGARNNTRTSPNEDANDTTIQYTDTEIWTLSAEPASKQSLAVTYGLMLLGAALLAGAFTLSIAGLPAEVKVDGDVSKLGKSALDSVKEIIKDAFSALAQARGPNMLAIAGLAVLALAVFQFMNADTSFDQLPEMKSVLEGLNGE